MESTLTQIKRQTAFARAYDDAWSGNVKRATRNACVFALGSALFLLLKGCFEGQDGSTVITTTLKEESALYLLFSLGGAGAFELGSFLWAFVRAPYRQRNEAWSAIDGLLKDPITRAIDELEGHLAPTKEWGSVPLIQYLSLRLPFFSAGMSASQSAADFEGEDARDAWTRLVKMSESGAIHPTNPELPLNDDSRTYMVTTLGQRAVHRYRDTKPSEPRTP